MLKPIL